MRYKDTLINQFGFSQEDWEQTQDYFHIETLSPKESFLTEGSISDRVAIVESGTLRAFHHNERQDEITTQFFTHAQLVISNPSFSQQVPSEENIVAIEPSELLVFRHEQAMDMLAHIPYWRKMQIEAAEHKIWLQKQRIIDFQTLTAVDRYSKFLQEYPQIARIAPLKHVASYLGIDQATLSRIRKKI